MAPRNDLHQILVGILGTNNVYFQPPPTVKMVYPCIVYSRDTAKSIFANDRPYRYVKQYQVTVIDANPDSIIPDKVAQVPRCVHNRFFTAEQLNHDVFKLFF